LPHDRIDFFRVRFRADLRLISNYTFTGESRTEKIAVRNVTRFDLSYMHYDDKGQAKLADKPEQIYRTACVGLNLRAAQDLNLYARETGKTPSRRQPTVEIATKMWSQRKLSEAVYPEYFSSVDDDLRY
jgi:hypothetical protein